ncbi:MAG: tRNA guanosine(34) transglycosylase Tgt [Patescibacteria group bacterium]
MISFQISKKLGRARRGQLQTNHGPVETPAYLPCGTHGTIKTLSPQELNQLEFQLILSNIYHLYLRPGIDRIERLGGLHKFMGWDKAIFTDSGGFQAFSLGKSRGLTLAKTTEEGIAFRSHLDGSRHFFRPEDVVRYQEQLGVDIATCLDVCTGFPESERTVGWAVDLTNEWAERSIKVRSKKLEVRSNYFLYGMVQGSIYPELRRRSAEFLRSLPFDGYAIGGNMYTFGAPLAELASEKPAMWEILDLLDDLLPKDKPRHLLGVGEPADIIEGVRHGIDTFDCVMATRIARNGAIWLWRQPKIQNSELRIKKLTGVLLGGGERYYQRVNMTTSQFAQDSRPLDETCLCPACTSGLSRAWFHHAFRVGEQLAMRLATLHNLAFLQGIMQTLRTEIEAKM